MKQETGKRRKKKGGHGKWEMGEMEKRDKMWENEGNGKYETEKWEYGENGKMENGENGGNGGNGKRKNRKYETG